MTRTDWVPPKGQGFTFFAPHHFYWGLILLVWAFWDIFRTPPWVDIWIWLRVGVGLWLLLDDVVQHTRQKTDPDYHTLWHNAYWGFLTWVRARLRPYPAWAWLVRFLDWLATV